MNDAAILTCLWVPNDQLLLVFSDQAASAPGEFLAEFWVISEILELRKQFAMKVMYDSKK